MISNRKARLLVLSALLRREMLKRLQNVGRVPHSDEGYPLVRKFYEDNAERLKAKYYGE